MSFWKEFNQASMRVFENETEKSSIKLNNWQEKEKKYQSYTDEQLLRRVRSASGEDRYFIEKILRNRCYVKKEDGTYDRKNWR